MIGERICFYQHQINQYQVSTMFKLIFISVFFAAFFQGSFSSERSIELENTIFQLEETKIKPTVLDNMIQELHEIYSASGASTIYKDIVEKLAQLPTISSGCTDDTFSKFDQFQGLKLASNVRTFVFYKKTSLAKKCDKELYMKFFKTINNMDSDVISSISRMGDYVRLTTYNTSGGQRSFRPLFSSGELARSVYDIISEASSAKEVLTRNEFDTLYKSFVLMPCKSTTPDFDEISQFYIRHYLDKYLLNVCQDFTRKWTFNAEVCNTIKNDGGEIADAVYNMIQERSEQNDNQQS